MQGIDYKAEARGKPCLIQIPGVCVSAQEDPDRRSTVPHHVRRNNLKIDELVAWACWTCHDWLHTQWTQQPDDDNDEDLLAALKRKQNQRDLWELEGMFRTQKALIEKGKL